MLIIYLHVQYSIGSPGDYHGYDIVVRISEDNSACFNLSDVIVDDDVTESTETFTVEIVSVTLLEISIMPNVTEVSIVDSDSKFLQYLQLVLHD